MSRTAKLTALVASIGLVATGGLGAATIGLPTVLQAPDEQGPGLGYGLPEEDRRAIQGEPYPAVYPAPEASAAGAPVDALASADWNLLVAPEGIDQGLWDLLPDEDRRAILGEPYPILLAAAAPSSADAGERTLAPPPGSEDFGCRPFPSLPEVC
jgi:hypothetical protein